MTTKTFRLGAFAAVFAFLAGTVLSAEAGRRTRSTSPPPPVTVDETLPVVSVD
jgi:hypothetical protein